MAPARDHQLRQIQLDIGRLVALGVDPGEQREVVADVDLELERGRQTQVAALGGVEAAVVPGARVPPSTPRAAPPPPPASAGRCRRRRSRRRAPGRA
jgi:hypothetical protein